MSDGLAVSVLDFVGMRVGESAGSAIARSVELARHAEKWGYKRYWLGEFHSINGVACAATAVLIGHMASATKRIRVGSGGVMLPNHAPLIVAEQFGTLEALYPGRIDLGVGRAPGGDSHAMRALGRDMGKGDAFSKLDVFSERLEELWGFLGAEKPGQQVRAIPGQGSNVPITVLGSSCFSAEIAANHGLPYAFAAHFAPEFRVEAAALYRKQFKVSAAFRKPYLIMAVPVIAAETDGAALRLFTTAQQRFLRLIRNEPIGLLPAVDSMQPLWSAREQAAVNAKLDAAIVGSAWTVKAGLEKLVRQTGADELIVVTDTFEQADRLESYRIVAEIAKKLKIGAEGAKAAESKPTESKTVEIKTAENKTAKNKTVEKKAAKAVEKKPS
jgi:luciferase family oxidoreductase group 1